VVEAGIRKPLLVGIVLWLRVTAGTDQSRGNVCGAPSCAGGSGCEEDVEVRVAGEKTVDGIPDVLFPGINYWHLSEAQETKQGLCCAACRQNTQ